MVGGGWDDFIISPPKRCSKCVEIGKKERTTGAASAFLIDFFCIYGIICIYLMLEGENYDSSN